MDDTIRRLAKVLGATGLEGHGADVRFVVDAPDGSRLKVNVEGARQRFMCVLQDAKGVTRTDLDLSPVKKVVEDPNLTGRVTLQVGTLEIHLDTKPTLAVEVLTAEH